MQYACYTLSIYKTMGVRMIPYAHDNFRPAIHLLPKTETRKQENAMHAKTIRNCGTAQKGTHRLSWWVFIILRLRLVPPKAGRA